MVSATVDTGALRHNLQLVRQWAPNSRVMAVIKANAYGHGLITVARALESADAFAVARVDEGLALRQAGIQTRTVLLEGVFDGGQLDAAAAAGFELVIHTPEQIDLLRRAPLGTSFKVWLKLDTGMNRLGFKGTDFEQAHEALGALPAVQSPVNLFTHFSSADDPDSPTTATQLKILQFRDGVVGRRAQHRQLRRYAELQGGAGGLGAARDLLLYGASPFFGSIGTDFGLKPAMTLNSHIIAVKHVAAGERVGYGGNWVAQRPTTLAVAAVGYGDGYPRNLASGSPVLVNGERAPLAGRVSMDMIGIDVTDAKIVPSLGDPVTLWGEGLPVEEIAVYADTIPYELLCGISQRVAVALR
jgi:alanine racemase